jgi:hypothetical protein
MVCGSGALIGEKTGGRVGVAGRDDGESLGGDCWAEALSEGESDVFFERIVRQVGSGVRASVCGIEEDEVAIEGGEGLRRGRCRLRSGRCGLRSCLCWGWSCRC